MWVSNRNKNVEQNFKSWEGFPQVVEGNISFYDLENANFSGIGKIKLTADLFIIPYAYSGPLLGFLKLNIEKLMLLRGPKASEKTKQAVEIINKYIESKDILECQDELIDNGLSKYAKL
jgi:hypothetical protein